MTKMKSPDKVCVEFAGVQLNVSADSEYVYIEGDENSLRFLAKLIEAQATFEKDDHFFLGPQGPGNLHFSDKSTLGLSIQRIENDSDA